MTHVAVRRPSMRGNQMTETVAAMGVGDQGETLVAMNLRSEVGHKSEIIGSVPEQTLFTVVETGGNNRALISAGNATGWISTKTDLDQALAKKIESGSGAFPVFEALVQLSLREKMEFNSEALVLVNKGTQFDVIEMGAQHRYKILVDGQVGWITGKTDQDHPLIKNLSTEGAPRMTKNLDSLVVRAASQAQVNKVKSEGRGVRMGKTRSTESLEGRSGPTDAKTAKGAGAKSPKAAPALSKLACCCSA